MNKPLAVCALAAALLLCKALDGGSLALCAVRGWDSRKLVHMDGEKTELDATVGSACSVRG